MITITNNNIYYSEFSVLSFSTLENVEKVKMKEIINFLSDDVEFGETVTLKRLFDIIGSNVAKFNEIFFSALGGYTLEPYLQEIQNNPTEEIESEFLEIHWFSDRYEDDLNIYPSLHGISSNPADIAYGTALGETELNASAGIDGLTGSSLLSEKRRDGDVFPS